MHNERVMVVAARFLWRLELCLLKNVLQYSSLILFKSCKYDNNFGFRCRDAMWQCIAHNVISSLFWMEEGNNCLLSEM